MTDVRLSVLGRGVLINATDTVPVLWAKARVVDVRGPESVGVLHEAWRTRESIVVRLHFDPAIVREPDSFPVEPWRIDPGLELLNDRLHFLLWANNYDARNGVDPIWWWGRKAARLGAAIASDELTADVILPDDTLAWIDGGPRHAMAVRTVHSESVEAGRLRVAPTLGDAKPSTGLAADQYAAISHSIGPARIIAPAGSGKTRVLTERLRHVLGDRQWERETVCAIAYNKKAQEELALRCAEFSPRVVTLNALGWELLGRPPVVEEREIRNILSGLVPKQQRRANVDPIAPYLDALGQARLGLRNPAEVENATDDVPGFAEVFGMYRETLKDRGAVDFDEQIYAAVERLLHDGAFRRQQQARFRHLLVDEFQDLTPAHILLVRLLSAPTFDVFGVGDDDQVIYGHAGANPQFLIGFDRYFPGAVSYELEVNYRCAPGIVDGARSLLSYNHRRVAKSIVAGRSIESPSAAAALVVERHRSSAAATALVTQIEALRARGIEPREIAVLTRVNSLLLAPQVALGMSGVPITSVVDERLLDRTGTRAALAYLRIAAGAAEGEKGFRKGDLLEVLRRPSRGLPIWIDKWFRSETMRISDVRSITSRLDDDKVSAKIDALADDLDGLVRASKTPSATVRSTLRHVKDVVGLGQAMSMLDASSSASHLDDLEALEQVADLHPELDGFEAWLRTGLQLRSPQNAGVEGGGAVTLSTIHRVKGQEWNYVILFAVNDGIFPHRLTEDPEEERRILHVGITRGREQTILLTDIAKHSPFLAEIDGSAVHTKPVPTPSPTAHRSGGALSKASPGGKPKKPDVGPYDEALFERLRTWRRDRSKADSVPPYVVFSDDVLRSIARVKPTTAVALSRISGIGPAKLDRYADEVLSITTS
jgi:DNA helicase II / ATP-dependent DNA helicase PcrA